MGNVASAVNAAQMSSYSPRLLISAGIAGSLDPMRAWIGDVIIPTSVYHYRYNKVFDGEHSPTNNNHGVEVFQIGKFLLRDDSKQEKLPTQSKAFVTGLGSKRKALSAAIAKEPLGDGLKDYLDELRIKIGTLEKKTLPKRPEPMWIEEFATFSWEKVLDSMAYAKAIPRTALPPDCVCVEMESYGFAEAVKRFVGDNSYTIPLVVRGISDIVGHKANSDGLNGDETPRTRAMQSVARALDFLIFDVQFAHLFGAAPTSGV